MQSRLSLVPLLKVSTQVLPGRRAIVAPRISELELHPLLPVEFALVEILEHRLHVPVVTRTDELIYGVVHWARFVSNCSASVDDSWFFGVAHGSFIDPNASALVEDLFVDLIANLCGKVQEASFRRSLTSSLDETR